ncbi:hypothetical protein G6K91_22055 [Agrobacterium rhizogenes]|nr:hypothetical protein [Rhizobium rhizogenes]NTG56162.1 hypothetical protein [Rhizobium rhizogenes]NTH01834.1 hypothetical protein [Rhizobium rhizogenes]NTI57545.1 hypothetical protein [Rhizobium rhizogenes]
MKSVAESDNEKIRRLDSYGATLAAEAEARLAKRDVLLDAYANQVFALQEENRSSSGEE